MTEAFLLTHLGALLAGIVGTGLYLKHGLGWISPLQNELNLIKHTLGLHTAAAPSPHPSVVSPSSASGPAVSSPSVPAGATA